MIEPTFGPVRRTRTMFTPDPHTVTTLVDDWYPFASACAGYDEQIHAWCTNEFGYGGLKLKQDTETYCVERERRWAFWEGYRFSNQEHALNFKLRWGA